MELSPPLTTKTASVVIAAIGVLVGNVELAGPEPASGVGELEFELEQLVHAPMPKDRRRTDEKCARLSMRRS